MMRRRRRRRSRRNKLAGGRGRRRRRMRRRRRRTREIAHSDTDSVLHQAKAPLNTNRCSEFMQAKNDTHLR